MTKPIQRLSTCCLHLLPLVLLFLKRAAPQVVVSGPAIVPCKDVHGTIVEDDCVIGPRARQLALSLNA